MNEYESAGLIQLLLLIPFLVMVCFFLYSQQKALSTVRREYRHMPPGQVWLQLIPIFGLGWQFHVISKISNSLRDDLSAPNSESIFSDLAIPTKSRPTYASGITYAVFVCISILPLGLIKSFLSLIALILLIVYWVELARYTKRLRNRALLAGF